MSWLKKILIEESTIHALKFEPEIKDINFNGMTPLNKVGWFLITSLIRFGIELTLNFTCSIVVSLVCLISGMTITQCLFILLGYTILLSTIYLIFTLVRNIISITYYIIK